MQIPTIWPPMPPNLASDTDEELIESNEDIDVIDEGDMRQH